MTQTRIAVGGGRMRDIVPRTAGVEYATIDLNATGTTTVYDGATESEVYGVYLNNGGSTAAVNLEVTDGTDTAVLREKAAGENLEFGDTIRLDPGNALQINVTAAEGAAQSNTATVLRAEG